MRYSELAISRSGGIVPFLLLGLEAVGWAGHSLITGKGYYKGCPPGGFDRKEDPFPVLGSDSDHSRARDLPDFGVPRRGSFSAAGTQALT